MFNQEFKVVPLRFQGGYFLPQVDHLNRSVNSTHCNVLVCGPDIKATALGGANGGHPGTFLRLKNHGIFPIEGVKFLPNLIETEYVRRGH